MIYSVDNALSLAIVSILFPKQDVPIFRNILTPLPKKNPQSPKPNKTLEFFLYTLQKSVHHYDNDLQTVGQVPG